MHTTQLAPLSLIAFVLASHPAPAQFIRRVSVDSQGNQGSLGAPAGSMSYDGRLVVFSSGSPGLVSGDRNGKYDIFAHDSKDGRTWRVSEGLGGAEANGHSLLVTISGDGAWVAFTSFASNLVPGDTNGTSDVFLHELATGTTTLVSVDSAGTQSNGPTGDIPSLSMDGRLVAFGNFGSNLVAGDTNGVTDVFLHDRVTGQTTRVSVDSSGQEANQFCQVPHLSGDGSCVCFWSASTNLVPGDTNADFDVFVHEVATGTTTRINVSSTGQEANDTGRFGRLSFDGRFVVFESLASNLVPGDTNGQDDVFVRDRLAGTTRRVSVSSSGQQANGFSQTSDLSPDGHAVFFASKATNLIAGDTNGFADIFRHDLVTGTTTRVGLGLFLSQGNGTSLGSFSSWDGEWVAFTSEAWNLVPGDSNKHSDAFVTGPAMHLVATPPSPSGGSNVTLEVWPGVPGDLYALAVTGVDGAPLFQLVDLRVFPASGVDSLTSPVPPVLSGHTLELAALWPFFGRVEGSNRLSLTIQ